jgi:hypothetical protein
LPNLLSHYQDGSRHDYSAAAEVPDGERRGHQQPILSDDAETISYYLPENLRRTLLVRTKVTTFRPANSSSSRGRTRGRRLPQIRGRHLELMSEIYKPPLRSVFSHPARVPNRSRVGRRLGLLSWRATIRHP